MKGLGIICGMFGLVAIDLIHGGDNSLRFLDWVRSALGLAY
jgi:hypothetical protein